MLIEEAKRNIDLLKSKLHKTRSNKTKVFLMSDILNLEHFINISDPTYSSNVFTGDMIYSSYRNKLIKERVNVLKEVLKTNDENAMIANHLLSEYEEAKFIPFIFDRMKTFDKKRSYEYFREFIGYMGPLAIKNTMN